MNAAYVIDMKNLHHELRVWLVKQLSSELKAKIWMERFFDIPTAPALFAKIKNEMLRLILVKAPRATVGVSPAPRSSSGRSIVPTKGIAASLDTARELASASTHAGIEAASKRRKKDASNWADEPSKKSKSYVPPTYPEGWVAFAR
ncbi:hypothetical protein EJ06DRAFT_524646 [Trichodelitschia bisporula]|uniref:Uncharacterized protein n=1 Tax=Trichodelitschia bisporula TaxID=703511 RepID=A0A6G1HLR9_9PEZI|nr:hypothetical protein EJ06DRAFT_524646 [Trichodelitschia bisporula]